MAFELFTHATRFLGRKVVLLGLYNGQGLESEPEEDVVTYSRVDGEVRACGCWARGGGRRSVAGRGCGDGGWFTRGPPTSACS